jgi:SAM-dependent methyltransferase
MSKENFLKIKDILNSQEFLIKEKNLYIDKRTDNYCSNFGLQWNTFTKTQYDSHTGYPLTRNRLLKASEWNLENLKDKLVLEIGSGAGRFTEILLSTGAYVVSNEISDAIYANIKNNNSNKIIFIKSSLYDLNYLNNFFDYVLCYGVAQHTPNVIKTYGAFCCQVPHLN